MANQVTAIVKSLDEFIEGLAQRLNLGIVARLKKDTPIDTGWARVNWVPSITQPFTGTAGTRLSAEKGQLDLSPQSQGIVDLVSRYRLYMGNIYITNNVDYILKLNDGSSKQAPKYFVQLAIEKEVLALGGRP